MEEYLRRKLQPKLDEMEPKTMEKACDGTISMLSGWFQMEPDRAKRMRIYRVLQRLKERKRLWGIEQYRMWKKYHVY